VVLMHRERRTERRLLSVNQRLGTAHLECSLATMLKTCGTAGPASGNLFLDLEDEGLARECRSEGVAVARR
jgi:hypothetical protein